MSKYVRNILCVQGVGLFMKFSGTSLKKEYNIRRREVLYFYAPDLPRL